MRFAKLLLLLAVSASADAGGGLNGTTVFAEGLGGVACYRIPSVVQAASGTLVAFAEARHGSCGDAAVHALAFRRSTDGGATWSEPGAAVGNASYLVGNPSAVALEDGRLMLIYVKHSLKCKADCGTGNGFVTSSDDGATWSSPVDISTMWGPASGSLPGPGTALQLTTGAHAGRILVPAHHSAYVHDFVAYSDDNGNHPAQIPGVLSPNGHAGRYHVGNHPPDLPQDGRGSKPGPSPSAVTPPALRQAVLTQLSNGSVLLNMRHQASPIRSQ
jgi:hypothetical protein